MEKIGKFATISDRYIICSDKNGIYACKNYKAFVIATAIEKARQKIIKVVGKVLFTNTIALVRCYADDNVKNHLQKISGKVEEKLEALIGLCAGADIVDWNLVKNFSKVEMWEELKVSSGLDAGLGYPGTGVSILKIKNELSFGPEYYLQIVDSAMEGYCVSHIELSKELVVACNTQVIKNIFKIKN